MSPPLQGRAAAAALAAAALVMLVPANLLPVISLSSPQQHRTDTILSSIAGLFESGLWPLAIVVFCASIAVPVLKIWGIGWLVAATRESAEPDRRRLTRIFRVLDFIGRWSMLDVFLVGFLAGVVQFGAVASVRPEKGIVPFAAAVVLTMLATHAFDPRSLWQK